MWLHIPNALPGQLSIFSVSRFVALVIPKSIKVCSIILPERIHDVGVSINGNTQNGWFIGKIHLQMDELGVVGTLHVFSPIPDP